MAAKHIVCPHCHAVNRVPEERFRDQPKCGACRAPLFDGHPVELGQRDFRTHVERGEIPLVVDFWAPWCGPCRMMAPVFEQLAGQWRGRAQFAKVNTEAEGALAAQFAIRSIPTVALFRGGREIGRTAGAMDASRLQQWIESSLGQA
jgi:thioredoxin 2